jgi:phage shock protein C
MATLPTGAIFEMTTAQSTQIEAALLSQPAVRPVPLPLRSDTFLGVCEAIGQDFGFNPNYLRVPFGALLLWNPVIVLSVYVGLGCLIAATRWFYPATERSTPRAATERLPANKDDRTEAEERLAA